MGNQELGRGGVCVCASTVAVFHPFFFFFFLFLFFF